MTDADPLSGSRRAAILLMSMGEAAAAEVLKYVNQQEVQAIGRAMSAIRHVSSEQVQDIASAFAEDVVKHTSLGIGTEEYLRSVLVAAMGEEAAERLLDRILQGRKTNGLEALKWMEPQLVADIIAPEHPQVAAVVVSQLSHERAAAVLLGMSEQRRADVVMRIATLQGVQSSALMELDEIIERRISASRDDGAEELGGRRAAAEIVLQMGPNVEADIMERIGSVDDELGGEIKELMFVFDSLGDLDDRGMQALLREINGDLLGVALKGAEKKTSDLILGNMSSRAAEILREDMEARGPVRLSEVEEAQKEILAVALQMAEDGKLNLGGGGEEYV
ncbi:MAG: flagellar motor switch protein FliG [Pseudomonadota bacterium]